MILALFMSVVVLMAELWRFDIRKRAQVPTQSDTKELECSVMRRVMF